MKNIKKSLSFLVLLTLTLAMTGCGSHAQTQRPIASSVPAATITAAQVFDPQKQLNHTWTFVNGYGDTTWITVQPVTSDFMPTGTVNLVFQKNSCRAYWGAGICDALIHFALSPQPDGSWASMTTLFDFPAQIPAYANGHRMITSDFMPVSGMFTPYTIIPASATDGKLESVSTDYDRYDAYDAYTFNSIVYGQPSARVFWQTTSYIENVTTPVYSGPALVSEQFESSCIHEKWYLAPDLGIVKIVPLDNGSCTPSDPNLAIVRIS